VQVIVGAIALALLAAAIATDRASFELHVLPLRCFVRPSDLRVVTAWRVGFGVVGLALLLVLRPLGRWLASDRARGTLLRSGIAVLLALIAIDCVRRSGTRAGKPLEPPQLPPVRSDERLDWVYDGPRTSVFVEDDRAVMYAVDAVGSRVHAQTDAIDPAQPTLLFVGESVVFGLGVHWEEAFPTIVGRELGLQVVNAGVHGYGDDQIYLTMLDRLADLRQPVAVVWLTMADVLERDVETWRLRHEVLPDGTVVPVPPEPELLRESPVVALFERLAPGQSSASVRIPRAIYAAADRAVRARGGYPLFVLTNYQRPCLPDASGRPSIEGLLFDGLPVQHVRVDLDPEALVHTNGHPDASSHARLARGIVDALRAAHVP
jgi:hypothetical protein